eukprot:scaffold112665_cov69-Phaeocystis_antarctica.AAC.8
MATTAGARYMYHLEQPVTPCAQAVPLAVCPGCAPRCVSQVRAVGQGAAGDAPHHRRRGGRARVARAQRGGSVGRDHKAGAHGILRAAAWDCMGLQPRDARGCSLGIHGAAAWGCTGLQPGDAWG